MTRSQVHAAEIFSQGQAFLFTTGVSLRGVSERRNSSEGGLNAKSKGITSLYFRVAGQGFTFMSVFQDFRRPGSDLR